MGIAYPPRLLAEPRSGRYAGCERATSEVFGCIPHGCARAAGVGLPERSEPEGQQGAARERFLNEVEKVGGGGHWTQSILLLVRLAAC